MPVYNSLISRSASNPPAMVADDASALIPEDVAREIVKNATLKSAAMQLFKHRQMSRKQQRMAVLSVKPTAYFVTSDTGLKQTTELNWTNKYLNAEELAVIVPMPKNLFADADYDIWDEARPELEEAIGVAIDDAIFFGNGAPSSWPTALVTAAANAGNTITRGATSPDIAADLNAVMKTVEADGYSVNGWVIRPQFKADLRGLRTSTNALLFAPPGPEANNVAEAKFPNPGLIWGEKAFVSQAGLGAFASTGGAGFYEAIAGDFNQGIIGIRDDINYMMSEEAVITDNTGAIIYNLFQQDMVALRVTFRVAWQVPNPPTRMQPTEASRYPFGVLRQT